MLTRTARLQLLAVLLVTLLGVGYTGFRYAGFERFLGSTTYPVEMQLADSGGIFTGADVTYRGVSVGRVGPLTLTSAGVTVELEINNSAPSIPADVNAAVRNLSAIGEQYVDLLPTSDGGATIHAGSVIPVAATTVPLGVEDLVVNLDTFVRSVPLDALQTVVDELGAAFTSSAVPLQKSLDATSEFTQAATDALPQTTALLRDGRTVLTTQNDTAGQFKDFSRSLAQLADQLNTSDPDLRRLIRTAPLAGDQVSGLLDVNGPGLGTVVADLLTVTRIAEPRQTNLAQVLVTAPHIAAAGINVVPGDGTAHLGLALNIYDPLPCTKGYEGTPRRSGASVTDTPVNAQAYCAETRGSTIDVRGAQNVPKATTPGSPGPTGTRSDTKKKKHEEPAPTGTAPTSTVLPLSSIVQILLP